MLKHFSGFRLLCDISRVIRECEITGSDGMMHFAKKLIGCRHMVDEMKKIFLDAGNTVADSDIYKFF